MTKDKPNEIIRESIPSHCQRAAFAGGCFWGLEASFQSLTGVLGAISGYGGGQEFDPGYEAVRQQKTGHRETVLVYFDPKRINYDELLTTFWGNIDPTDGGGQHLDRGPSYQTAVFYLDQKQKQAAEASRSRVQKRLGQPVATEIQPYTTFYQAEDYHQNFYCGRQNGARPANQP